MRKMLKKSYYEPLPSQHFYIDKTGALEEGLRVFPAIYVEGAAAMGKTTAVRMLLEKHEEITSQVFFMDQEMMVPDALPEKLTQVRERMDEEDLWVIFENLPAKASTEIVEAVLELLLWMPQGCRVIFLGRERPWEELLELFWKRKLEWISLEELLFQKEEVRSLAERMGLAMDTDAIWSKTGGWPGCVDVMLRLCKTELRKKKRIATTTELRNRYEVDRYIQKEILACLSGEELDVMNKAAVCPWLNEALCQEVWGMKQVGEILSTLERKGMLLWEPEKERWKIAPLFRNHETDAFQKWDEKAGKIQIPEDDKALEFQRATGCWYEKEGHIREALFCLKRSGAETEYRTCLLKHYEKIPFLNVPYGEVMDWKEDSVQICYLRGMYCYERQDTEGLKREMNRLKRMVGDAGLKREIFLNLSYVCPEVTLEEWLAKLPKGIDKEQKICLYGILGSSLTFLCGLRDLTGMFACSKKEENRRARIWKEQLGEKEWKAYCLARLDYYLETERKDSIQEEDWRLLMEGTGKKEKWQFSLVRMYLMCKLQKIDPDKGYVEKIRQLEHILLQEEHSVCGCLTESVGNLYSLWYQEKERLSSWLRYAIMDSTVTIHEGNYMMFCCRAKGYLYLNQYERAEKILRKVIPYVQYYHRYRFLAELLFQEAIVKAGTDLHGQAVKYAIESFLVTGKSRYVGFYTGYGEKGKAVLEAYEEWIQSNMSEGWHRKKKYNYGNVLRMPMPDYIEAILRRAKKRSSVGQPFQEEHIEERLTMMETIILQNIGRGMTNTEICEELGIKLPTVKSHIYSLYKKLGANRRTQAILKGKELGILK